MPACIKNWNKFQHYKNRRPPWIRLYRDLLDDPEFEALPGDLVKTLIKLWLAVSDFSVDGELPAIDRLALRMHVASDMLARQIEQLKHWVEYDASYLLATRKQLAIPEGEQREISESDQRESRSDTEREQRNNARTRATKTNDDFELFWKSYPKKIGKKDALKAFQKARKSGLPEIEVVVASIEKQRKSDQWRRDNGQYIPNPSTWLNQGRWDDELREGPGRKLTTQELAQREISEWLEEEEAKDGTEDSGLLFAGSGRIISGKVVTDKADEFGMVKNVKGR